MDSSDRGAAILDGIARRSPAIEQGDPRPEPPPATTSRRARHDLKPIVELVAANTLEPEAIRWLWEGWLARGKLDVMAGPPGGGKTTLAGAIAATLTCAGRWPDGTRVAQAMDVVLWSGEDGVNDTLLPRMIAAGADTTRVHFVTTTHDAAGSRAFDPASDMEALAARVRELPNVGLLVVDPIVSMVAGDSHKNSEVRRALQPIVDLAKERDIAVLGVSHFSKGSSGADPLDRVTGSLAFGAVARIVIGVVKVTEADGTTRRIMARVKSNISRDGDGFEFWLEHHPIEGHPNIRASHIMWGKALTGDARTLLAEPASVPPDKATAQSNAETFLRDVLASGEEVPASIIIDQAKESGGISKTTLKRTADRIGVKSRKSGMDGGWVWRLPLTTGPKKP